jgi:hypothetical protein
MTVTVTEVLGRLLIERESENLKLTRFLNDSETFVGGNSPIVPWRWTRPESCGRCLNNINVEFNIQRQATRTAFSLVARILFLLEAYKWYRQGILSVWDHYTAVGAEKSAWTKTNKRLLRICCSLDAIVVIYQRLCSANFIWDMVSPSLFLMPINWTISIFRQATTITCPPFLRYHSLRDSAEWKHDEDWQSGAMRH